MANKYLVEYRTSEGDIIGYLRMPPRSARNRTFTTTNIRDAARLDHGKAMDAAGRFNAMHRETGETATLVPAGDNLDPFKHAYIRRPGTPCDAGCGKRMNVPMDLDHAQYCDDCAPKFNIKRAVVEVGPRTCPDCGKGIEWCRC